ncbi:MAG: TetR/AcrR family transcriptional regulator [Eubacteriaceae bacterium]|nr:TetR/AcrR family transcriptional regulator [Eubacteriaceae bacterium]
MVYKKSIETKVTIETVSKNLFYEQGYKNTTIRQIAGLSNLQSQSTFYYYFNSKMELGFSLFERFFSDAQKLVAEYIHDKKDYLLILVSVQNIFFTQIIKDLNLRKFYAEAQMEFDYKMIRDSAPEYTDLFFDIAHKYNKDLSQSEIHFFLNAHVATIGKTVYNLDNQTLKISDEEAIGYLENFFPMLIGIEKDIINKKNQESIKIINCIPAEKLEKVRLL